MEVAELATKFTFQGSLKPLDNLNAKLQLGIASIAKVASVFTAAGLALNAFVVSTLASSDAMVQLSRETNVSVEAIQELGYVASVNGSSVDALENSIKNLSQKIGEAAIQGNADFARLGISIRDSAGNIKTAEQVLLELSDRFKELGLTVQEQKSYLSRLGIDESLLQTLNLGSKEIEKLRERARALGVVTSEQGDLIASFNDSLTDLKFGLSSIQKQVAIAFAPQMKQLSDEFVNFLIANKDLIQNGLKRFFELVNAGLGAIWNFGRVIYELIDNTIGLKAALIIAGGAMLYLNRAMLMNPVSRIIAGITALIAIVDDLYTGLKGGKSIIAEWFKEWFNIDIISLIRKIGEVFSKMVDIVKISFNTMFDGIKAMFINIVDFIKGIFDKVIGIYDKVVGKVKSFKKFFNFFGGDDEEEKKNKQANNSKNISSLVNDDNRYIDYKSTIPVDLSKINTPNITKTSNMQQVQNNNITIEIKTEDPKTAGRAVTDELQSVLNKSNVYFNKGGR